MAVVVRACPVHSAITSNKLGKCFKFTMKLEIKPSRKQQIRIVFH